MLIMSGPYQEVKKKKKKIAGLVHGCTNAQQSLHADIYTIVHMHLDIQPVC